MRIFLAFASIITLAALPALAQPGPYTCGQYLEDLSSPGGAKSESFNRALGFIYGAYYMANWSGSFTRDEAKLDRFDRSILANCRAATGELLFSIALQTAADYRRQ